MTAAQRHLLLLVALTMLLSLVNLGGYDLWPADEPRYAEVAREMMQTGDYLAPHVNGLPYKEKPPLLFWAIAAASWPFGDVTELSARLPSVVAAVVTVLCTYLLAARMYGARTALWAALVLLTGSRFWWEARTAQIDMLLTACLTVALLVFRVWQDDKRGRWLVMFYGAMALGVLAKGPAGIIFPLLLIFAYYGRRGPERRQTHWLLGTLAVVAVGALWLIPARMSVSGAAVQDAAKVELTSNLYYQTIGRFFLGVSKAQPPWYYFETLAVDLLPWTLILPWTLPWVWKRRKEGADMRLLLGWTIPAFVFFSICSGKRAIYILPMFPAFAILIARSVLDLVDGDHARWRKRTAFAWGVLLLGLGLAPLALRQSPYRDAWRPELLVFCLAAFMFAVNAFRRAFSDGNRMIHAAFVTHFAGLTLLAAMVVFPVVNEFKSARPFCATLRALSETHQDCRLYSLGFTREEYIFYAKHFHEPVLVEFCPPVPGQELTPDALNEAYKQVHKAVQKAVEGVPLADVESITDAERDALRAAIDQAIAASGVEPAIASAYEDGLRQALADFAKAFDAPTPAFMFVREDAWPIYAALFPHAPHYAVLRRDQVGNRPVLLLANPDGDALVTGAKPDA